MFTPYSNLDYLLDMVDRSQLNALGQTHLFSEKNDHYVCNLPLPGAEKTDIKISVSPGNVLAIEYRPEKKNPFAQPFSKIWTLKNADYDGLTAEYKSGILSVVVPKFKAFQTKPRTFIVN